MAFFQKLSVYIRQSINRGYWREVAAKTIEDLLDSKSEELELADSRLGQVFSGADYCAVLLGKDTQGRLMARVTVVDYATAMACLRFRRDFRIGNNLSIVNAHRQAQPQRLRVLRNFSDAELNNLTLDFTYGDSGLFFTERLRPITGLL